MNAYGVFDKDEYEIWAHVTEGPILHLPLGMNLHSECERWGRAREQPLTLWLLLHISSHLSPEQAVAISRFPLRVQRRKPE
jgi:hypothetical protein